MCSSHSRSEVIMSTLSRNHLVVALALVAGACETNDPSSCKVICSGDADCPDGQTCGDLGRCTAGQACPCTSGEFLGCSADDASARSCNAAGDGLELHACGEPLCSIEAGGCEPCVAERRQCTADQTGLETCSPDGLSITTEACAAGCATDHCAYLAPVYLSDVCDTPATMDTLDISASMMLDTSIDANCTGGIVTQAVGPELCLLRYASIIIGAALRVVGRRPLALVADYAVLVTGEVDISASGIVDGAGGGTIASGERAGGGVGGGGAGFRHAGGAGGSTGTNGGGGVGGPLLDPSPQTTGMIGGPGPAQPTNVQKSLGYPVPGAAGGGLLLISCHDSVTISGVIAANGGGSPGGKTLGTNSYIGATGGGAGGFVVIQGLRVAITGSLFANGGGGGGGCVGNCTAIIQGQDGQRSTTPAAGGLGYNTGANGGAGGTAVAPGNGRAGAEGSPGGGGGAAGRLRVYTPMGVSPTITPAQLSPAGGIETLVVPTR